jgi:hypothetical protein
VDTINIGRNGTRVEVSGTITAEHVYETKWGNEHHVRFTGSDGTLAFWKAARRLDVKVGDTLTVRATIKRYRILDGDLYVEVTNGRVLEDALAIF